MIFGQRVVPLAHAETPISGESAEGPVSWPIERLRAVGKIHGMNWMKPPIQKRGLSISEHFYNGKAE